MTDTTSGGAPQQPAPPQPPDAGKPVPVHKEATAMIARVAIQVFAATSGAIIVLVVLQALYVVINPIGVHGPQAGLIGGLIRFLLSLAALSIFVAFVGRTVQESANWLTVVAFVVVAALIVPTNDLLRIILTVTGSERTVDDGASTATGIRVRLFDPLPEPTSKKSGQRGCRIEFDGRCPPEDFDEVSMQIVESASRLLATASGDGAKAGFSEAQKLAVLQAADLMVRRYVLQEAATQVQARSAASALVAIVEGRGPAFGIQHASNPRYRRDLDFLRSEGLIAYAYQSHADAEPTVFGCNVANRLDEHDTTFLAIVPRLFGETDTETAVFNLDTGFYRKSEMNLDEARELHPVCALSAFDRRQRSTPEQFAGFPVDMGSVVFPPAEEVLLPPDAQTIAPGAVQEVTPLPNQITWRRLEPVVDAQTLRVSARSGGDPVLFIAVQGPSAELGEMVATNDDYESSSRNAQIDYAFDPGQTYFVGVRSFSETDTQPITLSIGDALIDPITEGESTGVVRP